MRRLFAAVLISLAFPAAADARDFVVHSFDGTPLAVTFEPAQGLTPGQKAPTILVGHGFGQSRQLVTSSEDLFGSTGTNDLRAAGFNTLAWDARGFGQSGGTVEIDNPAFEGRDVQALIDAVAKQPEALLDRPGDPRVGMTGASYGGGIELVAAGIDKRIDAIAPDIAWHSLLTALYDENTVKSGWGTALVAAGAPPAAVLGLLAPDGPQLGGLDGRTYSALGEGLTTGAFSPATQSYFAASGPAGLVNRIRVPTLLTQGTADTLFTLQEAITNYDILRGNGVPVKMVWFCGGHGVCLSGKGPAGLTRDRVITWMKRYLARDRSVDTGPRFEWVDDAGTLHSGPDYPLAARAPLSATGSGSMLLTPVTDSYATGDLLIAARPSLRAVSVDIPAPAATEEIVGAPTVSITYRGSAAPATTRLYGQIVDRAAGRVLGNVVKPIPVVLDGAEHTVTRPLYPIAAHVTPGSKLSLQIIPSTGVWDRQRSTGTVSLSRIAVRLPSVDPARSGRPAGITGALSLRFERPSGVHPRTRGTRLRVALRAFGGDRTVRKLQVGLRDARGALVAISDRVNLQRRRIVRLVLRRRLGPGRYVLRGSGLGARDVRLVAPVTRFRVSRR